MKQRLQALILAYKGQAKRSKGMERLVLCNVIEDLQNIVNEEGI